jgi:hypothetical protein
MRRSRKGNRTSVGYVAPSQLLNLEKDVFPDEPAKIKFEQAHSEGGQRS